jgi:polar amino acid transport system substrate-binding protein
MKSGKYKTFDDVKAAGSGVTISVLQNVYAEDLVHQALPEAKVDQYDSVDLIYQALNSGRADAAATDMSSAKWFVAQSPDQYVEGGYGWSPQTYSCAVKKGDLEFLHFVDIAFREAMTGVDFPTYAASFKKWFGEEPPAPKVGFPSEIR